MDQLLISPSKKEMHTQFLENDLPRIQTNKAVTHPPPLERDGRGNTVEPRFDDQFTAEQ